MLSKHPYSIYSILFLHFFFDSWPLREPGRKLEREREREVRHANRKQTGTMWFGSCLIIEPPDAHKYVYVKETPHSDKTTDNLCSKPPISSCLKPLVSVMLAWGCYASKRVHWFFLVTLPFHRWWLYLHLINTITLLRLRLDVFCCSEALIYTIFKC